MTFDKIVVELTRKCNMNPLCGHCFRGEPQDFTIDNESIDSLLKQTEIIGSLSFTGGEPTLAVDKMQYFLEQLYEQAIPLFRFSIVFNGLLYNEEIVQVFKDYSDFVKMCCGVIDKEIDVTKRVIISISIDKYHNHRDIAERNIERYKKALKGYAQVVKYAKGNIVRKEGNACSLACADNDWDFKDAVNKRVEILDIHHKPRCPQYKTYRLIKPEQIKICCDMYLSAKGNLLTFAIGDHGYYAVDYEKCIICNVNDSDIYESIIQYNEGKTDCISLLKRKTLELRSNPIKSLFGSLNYFLHIDEDDSDEVENDIRMGAISDEELAFEIAPYPNLLDKMIKDAESFNYNTFD